MTNLTYWHTSRCRWWGQGGMYCMSLVISGSWTRSEETSTHCCVDHTSMVAELSSFMQDEMLPQVVILAKYNSSAQSAVSERPNSNVRLVFERSHLRTAWYVLNNTEGFIQCLISARSLVITIIIIFDKIWSQQVRLVNPWLNRHPLRQNRKTQSQNLCTCPSSCLQFLPHFKNPNQTLRYYGSWELLPLCQSHYIV